jgi:hypothetical protein
MVALITRAEQWPSASDVEQAAAFRSPSAIQTRNAFRQTAPVAGSCAETSKGIQEEQLAVR